MKDGYLLELDSLRNFGLDLQFQKLRALYQQLQFRGNGSVGLMVQRVDGSVGLMVRG